MDTYGFPRRSETLGSAGLGVGAAWKVFWAPPMVQTNAAGSADVLCPYPFPGRYFLQGVGSSRPAGGAGTSYPAAVSPLVRITLTHLTIGAATSTFRISLNRHATLTSAISLVNAGAGTQVAHALMYMEDPTTLRLSGAVTGLAASQISPSIIYGGQDIWFGLTLGNAASINLVALVEYLEIPL